MESDVRDLVVRLKAEGASRRVVEYFIALGCAAVWAVIDPMHFTVAVFAAPEGIRQSLDLLLHRDGYVLDAV